MPQASPALGSRRSTAPAIALLALACGSSTREPPASEPAAPPSPPAMVKEQGALLLDPGPVPERPYMATVFRDGERRVLQLERSAGARAEGAPPPADVLDSIALPALAAGERVLLTSCERGGADDPEIVGIVGPETGERELLPASRAWRLDRAGEAIREIPAQDVRCYDDAAD